jgi:O-antigen ligase
LTWRVPWPLALAALLVPAALYPLIASPGLGIGLTVASGATLLAWASPAYPLAIASGGDLAPTLGIPLPDNFVAVTAFAWTSGGVLFALRRPDARVSLGVLRAPVVVLSALLFVLMVWRLGTSPAYAYGAAKTQLFVIGNLTVLIAAIVVAQRRADLDRFLLLLVAVAVVASVVILGSVAAGVATTLPDRFSLSASQSPIGLGRMTGTGILVALWLILTARPTIRFISLITLPLLTIAFLSAGSRGPLVALVVAATLLMVFSLAGDRKASRRMPLLMVGAVLAIAIASQVAPGAGFDRAASIFVGGDPTTDESNGRSALWGVALQAFLERPAIGLGTGGFSAVDPANVYPHNLFLEAAAEWGVVGLLLVAAIIGAGVVAVVQGIRRSHAPSDRAPAVLAGTLLAFALVNAMFSGDIARNSSLWLALGLAVGLRWSGGARGDQRLLAERGRA